MSPLFLSEDDIRPLTSTREAIGVLENAFRQQTTGEATILPRRRLATERVFLHMLGGAVPGFFGYKAYTTGAGKPQFLFYLFETGTGRLVSIMQADVLGQMRTGAATGLATRLLARSDARVATIFGAGWQAQSQLEAMDEIRDLERVWIVNRTPERAARFIEEMSQRVKPELKAADSPEAAVRGSDIVTTITGSREPVLFGTWLKAGCHVNAAGGNMMLRREVDPATILAAERVVVDSIEQARLECGEFVGVFGTGRRHWDEIMELKDVVRDGRGRQSSDGITFFKSQGVGLEDVALGVLVYRRAREKGVGRELDLGADD
jgi:alanine dehydrogenase